MSNSPILQSRRDLLRCMAVGSAAVATPLFYTVPGLFAEELEPKKRPKQTPSIPEGPFYPDKMPLDTDNDLLLVNDSITPAVGEITHLTGRILDLDGRPIRNAFVEIWQVDSTASYVHTRGRNPEGHDANFQGYGRFLTDSKGQYYFRTIKPIEYSLFGIWRTPHVHLTVSKNGKRILTTQFLVKGEPANKKDGLFRMLRTPEDRETILVDYKPIKESKIGELAANFDVVLGKTAEELEHGKIEGGIGKRNGGLFGGFGGGRRRPAGGSR